MIASTSGPLLPGNSTPTNPQPQVPSLPHPQPHPLPLKGSIGANILKPPSASKNTVFLSESNLLLPSDFDLHATHGEKTHNNSLKPLSFLGATSQGL